MKGLNLKIIVSFLGLTSMLNGVFMLFAVPFSIYHNEIEKWGILQAGITTILIGFFSDPSDLDFLPRPFGVFYQKDRFIYEENGERLLILLTVVHLFNFRTRYVGLNQIRSVFLPQLELHDGNTVLEWANLV